MREHICREVPERLTSRFAVFTATGSSLYAPYRLTFLRFCCSIPAQFVVENDNCRGGVITPPNKMIPVLPGRSEEMQWRKSSLAA